MVAGGQGGGGDLGQVAELGDEDDREAGPGDAPESRLFAVQLDVLIVALVPAAQQQHRAQREQDGNDDLQRALKHGHGTLLELKLEQNGDFEEIYNGNADRVWESRSHLKATNAGEKSISLSQLRTLQKEVDGSERIARMPESNAG